MPRGNRSDQFRPDEVAVVHVMNRVARLAMRLGGDSESGKCFSHRKDWFDDELKRLAAGFGIDLISSSILDNHFHIVLRSRPDIVSQWDDTEVARRWLYLCPTPNMRRSSRGPNEAELDSIRKVPTELADIRLRLSDISWWTRLMSQRIAQRANAEDNTHGHFWADRFNSVLLEDAEAVLACAVYVDLNLIRATLAATIELSLHTSIKCRIDALMDTLVDLSKEMEEDTGQLPAELFGNLPDAHLAPVELANHPGAYPCNCGHRCSDKGYAHMSAAEYIELVDWTARLVVEGKRGSTPADLPPVLERLGLSAEVWLQLTVTLDELFTPYTGLTQAHVESPPDVPPSKQKRKSSKLRFAQSCAV